MLRYVYITIFLLFQFSCTYKKEDVNPLCDIPDTVSFSSDIIPLFNTHCSLSGCHSGSSPEGDLNLEASMAYTQLTSGNSGYVDTVNPEFSVLYVSMKSVSSPMPPTGNLDDCTTELVLKWIEQNAKNN
jgi:hypothetical protein